MIEFRPKLWTGVSAVMLLAGGVGLDACSKTGDHSTASVSLSASSVAPVTAAAGETGEVGAQAALANVPEASRTALLLTQLRGFVLIAQKQTDGAAAGGILLSQGLLETFDKNPALYKAAGVDEALLRKAGKTGAAGDLKAALNNIDGAMAKAGGDPAAVLKGLVDISSGLYKEAVQPDSVDPIDYQHSLGAALSAQRLAAASSDPKVKAVRGEVDKLVALWPQTSAPDKPTPSSQILAQASRIELELS